MFVKMRLFPELAELESFIVGYEEMLYKIKAMPTEDVKSIFETYHEFHLIEIKSE